MVQLLYQIEKQEPEAKIAKRQWKLVYTDNNQEYLKFLNTYAVNNIVSKYTKMQLDNNRNIEIKYQF